MFAEELVALADTIKALSVSTASNAINNSNNSNEHDISNTSNNDSNVINDSKASSPPKALLILGAPLAKFSFWDEVPPENEGDHPESQPHGRSL